MKNSAYWRKRGELLEEAQHRKGLAYLEALGREYKRAAAGIEKDIAVWYQRFADNNEISFADARIKLNARELKELRWTLEEYIKYGEENAINQKWIKQLENASARFHITRLESLQIRTQQALEALYGNQLDSMDSFLRDRYTESYYHNAFEIQKGINMGWDIASINEKQLDQALSKPWSTDAKTFSDRIWTNKEKLVNTVQTELTQAVIRGGAPDEAIKNIAKRMNSSEKQSGRLVMTELSHVSAEAQKHCYKDLDVERFEVVGTLDGETCHTCGAMDGKIFKMSDYKSGETANPFHPWCRCCTVPYFDDNGGERIARDPETGETSYIDGDIKYEDWEKQFVDGDAEEEYNKIKEISFVEATTIKEAEQFARDTLGIPNVSYKGVDVTTANEWNKGLADTFSKYPAIKDNFGFVGEAHQRNKALKPDVQQFFVADLKRLNPNASDIAIKLCAEKETRKYMNHLRVNKNDLAQSFSPKYSFSRPYRGVTINKDAGKNSKKFVSDLIANVKTKFHPVGCDTIRSVLDHEIGHQFDDMLGIGKLKHIQELFDIRTQTQLTVDLSQYSWDNGNSNKYSEMIAEAWAEYCNNPEPREIAKAVGNAIEKEYKKKVKK